MSFSSAIAALHGPARDRVTTQLQTWRVGSDSWAQIADNIEHETALALAAFQSLLQAFSDALDRGSPPADAWVTACRGHHFHGAVVSGVDRPQVLGRAIAARTWANFISSAEESNLSEGQALTEIGRQSGTDPLPSWLDRILRRAPLGGPVVWATFDLGNSSQSPFIVLSRRTIDICTALGMGHHTMSDPLVLFAYLTTTAGTVLSMHRPTIAEAANYSYYRPHADPTSPCGYSFPLPPNPSHIAPQPELVHPGVLGIGLVFPYHLSTP